MKLTQDKQVITLSLNENETDFIHYYERVYKGSKILARSNGMILGNSFRYDGLLIKKYGRGRLKNAKAFHEQVEKADSFLRSEGYQFITTL